MRALPSLAVSLGLVAAVWHSALAAPAPSPDIQHASSSQEHHLRRSLTEAISQAELASLSAVKNGARDSLVKRGDNLPPNLGIFRSRLKSQDGHKKATEDLGGMLNQKWVDKTMSQIDSFSEREKVPRDSDADEGVAGSSERGSGSKHGAGKDKGSHPRPLGEGSPSEPRRRAKRDVSAEAPVHKARQPDPDHGANNDHHSLVDKPNGTGETLKQQQEAREKAGADAQARFPRIEARALPRWRLGDENGILKATGPVGEPGDMLNLHDVKRADLHARTLPSTSEREMPNAGKSHRPVSFESRFSKPSLPNSKRSLGEPEKRHELRPRGNTGEEQQSSKGPVHRNAVTDRISAATSRVTGKRGEVLFGKKDAKSVSIFQAPSAREVKRALSKRSGWSMPGMTEELGRLSQEMGSIGTSTSKPAKNGGRMNQALCKALGCIDRELVPTEQVWQEKKAEKQAVLERDIIDNAAKSFEAVLKRFRITQKVKAIEMPGDTGKPRDPSQRLETFGESNLFSETLFYAFEQPAFAVHDLDKLKRQVLGGSRKGHSQGSRGKTLQKRSGPSEGATGMVADLEQEAAEAENRGFLGNVSNPVASLPASAVFSFSERPSGQTARRTSRVSRSRGQHKTRCHGAGSCETEAGQRGDEDGFAETESPEGILPRRARQKAGKNGTASRSPSSR